MQSCPLCQRRGLSGVVLVAAGVIRICGNAGSVGAGIVNLAVFGAQHVLKANINIPVVATAMLEACI